MENNYSNIIFNERYKIIKPIGSGTFGLVFQIKDIQTENNYAMKAILTLPKNNTELDVLKVLDHESLVKFIEHFFHDLNLIIITEFCEDGDLSQKIKKVKQSNEKFSFDIIRKWTFQLHNAINYLHNKNVIHRDIKPQNIFLQTTNIKLGDFGVSRILSTNSLDASSIVGTQAYCSPQILLDQRYSYKADVWSSGCVLFELASLETFSLYRMKKNLIFIKNEIDELESEQNSLKKLLKMSLQYDECSRFSSQQIIKWLEPCLNNKTQNDVSVQINEFIEDLTDFKIWKVKDQNKYFKKISDTIWSETSEGKEFSKYSLVKQIKDQVILSCFRNEKNLLLKLTSDQCFFTYSNDIDSIDRNFVNGSWVSFDENDCLNWKVNNMEKYFKRNSTLNKWFEFENNEQILNEYKFVQHNRNEVVIQDVKSYIYYKLDYNSIKTGSSIYELDDKIYEGTWIKDD